MDLSVILQHLLDFSVVLCCVFSRVLRLCVKNAANRLIGLHREAKCAMHAGKANGEKELRT
jgi:hypothetical protein